MAIESQIGLIAIIVFMCGFTWYANSHHKEDKSQKEHKNPLQDNDNAN